MGITLFKKFLPWLLLITLGVAIFGGFRYYVNKVERLTTEKATLQTQLSAVNTNYKTLQNMYSISLKQNEELQKSQRESLDYVSELKDKLSEMVFSEEYIKDKDKLLKQINDYERCYAKHAIKEPSFKCYKRK